MKEHTVKVTGHVVGLSRGKCDDSGQVIFSNKNLRVTVDGEPLVHGSLYAVMVIIGNDLYRAVSHCRLKDDPIRLRGEGTMRGFTIRINNVQSLQTDLHDDGARDVSGGDEGGERA